MKRANDRVRWDSVLLWGSIFVVIVVVMGFLSYLGWERWSSISTTSP